MIDSDTYEQVMSRAKHRCEWAGCSEGRWLEVAHLEARGMGGKRPNIDDPANLAVLCKFHHDVYDGREHRGLKREMRYLLTDWLSGKRPRRFGDG